ncbi:MAG: gamma-glutamyl-gamma-aminobutyrate hydrolase family protein [Candidatus Desantisbacteria bacterium]
MRPIIGIGGSIDIAGRVFAHENYINAIHRAGGMPIILTSIQDEYILNTIQGMVITGGDDIPAEMFGEEPVCKITPEKEQRLQHDLWLIPKLRERNIPTLGICYGMQIVNVSLGGSLYQDIQIQCPEAINHLQRKEILAHTVGIKSGTILAAILRNMAWFKTVHHKDTEKNNPLTPFIKGELGKEIMVNSSHHQAVKEIGQGLIVSAISSDGIIEAIESQDGWFLGVQWHPERMEEESSGQIFSHIVDKAKRVKP